MSFPLVLQWRTTAGDTWKTLEVSSFPVSFPAKIRIDFSMAGTLPAPESLIDKIEDFLARATGKKPMQHSEINGPN